MELWEFYSCVDGYAKRQELRATESLVTSWQTGNFAGAAFGGKLKGLKHYLQRGNSTEKRAAPKISEEEFDRGLARAREGGDTIGD